MTGSYVKTTLIMIKKQTRFIKAHIPTEKCEICGRERIAKTLIKGEKEIPREILGNCKECGKLICNDCGHLCAECRGIVCKNCAHYDEKTDKYYCKEHIPKAGGCFIATAAYGTPFEPKLMYLEILEMRF